MQVLENDRADSIKIEEYRSCTMFCTGLFCQGTRTMLCIASKRTVYVHELNRTKQKHRKLREVLCPGNVQYIEMRDEKLFVGYPSSFAIYSVQGDGAIMSRWLRLFLDYLVVIIAPTVSISNVKICLSLFYIAPS